MAKCTKPDLQHRRGYVVRQHVHLPASATSAPTQPAVQDGIPGQRDHTGAAGGRDRAAARDLGCTAPCACGRAAAQRSCGTSRNALAHYGCSEQGCLYKQENTACEIRQNSQIEKQTESPGAGRCGVTDLVSECRRGTATAASGGSAGLASGRSPWAAP